MKSKHLYKRQSKGTYSMLRRYKHLLVKKLGYVRIHQAGYEHRQPTNNQLKMAGKPMRRKRQMDIVWHRLYKKYCRRRRKK